MKKLVLAILFLVVTTTLAKVPPVAGISREARCLASNIYHEARGEPFQGQLAVAIVTINRTKSPDYPNTICGVVYQYKQFSWTNFRHSAPINREEYNVSLLAAMMALENTKILGNFNATHYHTTKVHPRWGLKRVAKIGKHIFYR